MRTVVYVDDADDGRLYRLDLDGDAEPTALALSPPHIEGAAPYSVRYADLCIGARSGKVFAVRERHLVDEVVNDVVAIPLDGRAVDDPDAITVVAHGADFYAQLALDPDGRRLAFITWMLPDMPWDATELVVVELDGGATTVVAGGAGESIVEPGWAPDGTLVCCSDRSNWWNLYRIELDRPDAAPVAIAPVEGEVGGPLWVFGNRSYAWLGAERLVCVVSAGGTDTLAIAQGDGTPPREFDLAFTHIPQLVAGPGHSVLVVAGTPEDESDVWRIDLPAPGFEALAEEPERVRRLRAPRDVGVGHTWFATPETIDVPVDADTTTHAVLYRPTNPDIDEDATADPPPLIVLSHGGPTSAARVQLNLTVQFWTSRGFSVADVNYRGSTGFGRAYRDALNGAWGVADVADCAAVARHLATTGQVDPARLGIRGSSAGGYTTLAALCFTDTFSAGLSAYGIADLEILVHDTHKFESRYLDRLVGPWPEDSEIYRARSPIHHLDRLHCPVGVLQGAQDAVVPPTQAEAIVAALRAKGIPYATLSFPDEGHGFRKGPNIVRALEAELWFFAHTFGLELSEPIEPVPGAGLGQVE